MNELTIYTSECISCRYRSEMQQIRQFAHKHNLTVVTKRTNYSRQFQEEAKIMGLELPFIQVGIKAIPFKGVTTGVLAELL